MQPTTSTERIFLRLEQPGYPIDIVSIFLFSASKEDGPLPFEDVRTRLDHCAHQLPILRKKLAHAPLGIGEDHWIQTAHLDIDEHLNRVRVGPPNDLWALLGLVVDLTKDPLDRALPLWDAFYVEGMADGRTALVLRCHHALVDGVGTLEMHATLFDLEPKAVDPKTAIEEIFGEEDPSFLARALREIPERVVTEVAATGRLASAAAGAVTDAAMRPVKALTSALPTLARRPGKVSLPHIHRPQLPHLPGYVPSPTHHPPRTIFNRHVRNPEKNLSVVSLPLSEIREVRTATGATVNDVLLALVTGTLRRYLSGRGELPNEPLHTTCPVNVRIGGETDGSGNQITTMWVELPVHLADPAERLAYIHASTTASKAALETSRASWDVIATVGDMFLPRVVSAAMAFAQTPVFELFPPTLNLTVSTMPGSPVPLYLGGRKVENMYARAIIHSPVHLFFHSITYNGSVEFGVTTVKEVVPDVHALTTGLRAELDDLLAFVRTADST